ncbi:hypothetical protein DFH28DRAFT_666411 [Melampsora americana]|nr:hypothetical protein DFH28DRAFT_666411 [Melampsora americana]
MHQDGNSVAGLVYDEWLIKFCPDGFVEKIGHYEYISNLSLENAKESTHECPICLVGFLHGQRVIKLRCHHTHIFHQNCMTRLLTTAQQQGLQFRCPSCRSQIELPFPHEVHISWDSSSAQSILRSPLEPVRDV